MSDAVTVFRFAVAPSASDAYEMVREIRAASSRDCDAAALLGVPVVTLRRWLVQRGVPGWPARANVWVRWCLLFEPERVQTAFDLVTWGRFRTTKRRRHPAKVSPASQTPQDTPAV